MDTGYYAHARQYEVRGIWTSPLGHSDFSSRWSLIKGQFSTAIEKVERISHSRLDRGELGLWQRRFWEYMIRDEDDFNRMSITLRWNHPVKHGWMRRAADGPHFQFPRDKWLYAGLGRR